MLILPVTRFLLLYHEWEKYIISVTRVKDGCYIIDFSFCVVLLRCYHPRHSHSVVKVVLLYVVSVCVCVCMCVSLSAGQLLHRLRYRHEIFVRARHDQKLWEEFENGCTPNGSWFNVSDGLVNLSSSLTMLERRHPGWQCQRRCRRSAASRRRGSSAARTVRTSVGHVPSDIFAPPDSPPDNFPPYLGHFTQAVKAKIWKLAITRTADPNRLTSINFVHVNGKSIYIVDRRMMVVVEGRHVIHHVKRERKLPVGISSEKYVRENMYRGNVRIRSWVLFLYFFCIEVTRKWPLVLCVLWDFLIKPYVCMYVCM